MRSLWTPRPASPDPLASDCEEMTTTSLASGAATFFAASFPSVPSPPASSSGAFDSVAGWSCDFFGGSGGGAFAAGATGGTEALAVLYSAEMADSMLRQGLPW